MNLVEEILIKNTNINGSKIAVIFEDESISRSQLVEDLEKMALFLEKKGISPDDRVLLLLNDTPMFFFSIFRSYSYRCNSCAYKP
jgi:acyl-CoA synthetase (AMP-forming)/AMP-acid ligase II